MDTISCPHTPGDRNNQSEIVYHQNIEIEGKDVIVIDDAIELGYHETSGRVFVGSLSTKNVVHCHFVREARQSRYPFQLYAYEMENDTYSSVTAYPA